VLCRDADATASARNAAGAYADDATANAAAARRLHPAAAVGPTAGRRVNPLSLAGSQPHGIHSET